jgi:hypothetical protein
MLAMNAPCKSRASAPAGGRLVGAVAEGRPDAPGAVEPASELGSPSAVPSNPDSRLGRTRSPLAQGRVAMEPTHEPTFVGIDVSKDRLDVAVLPSGECFAAARDPAGLDGLAARLKPLAPRGGRPRGHRRLRDGGRGGPLGGRPAGGGRQPGPGPRLRQGARPARQDRPDRRRGHRTLRGRHPPRAAAPARRGHRPPRRPRRAPAADHRHDGGRAAAPEALPGTQAPEGASPTSSMPCSASSPRSRRRSTPTSAARRPGARRRTCSPPSPASGPPSPAP